MMNVLDIRLINNPQESIDTDIKMCIFFHIDTKKEPTSSEKGRKLILEAATIREDIVNKRLKTIGDEPLSYHMDNHCYKTYTSEVIQQAPKGFICTTWSSWGMSWNLEG